MTRLGPYSLYTIETGRFRLDGGAMFGIVPRVLWERVFEPDEKNRILLNMRCLLLEGSDRLILIDNGLGEKYDSRFAEMFAVDHEYATLYDSLGIAGFSVDDVTDVILTHLHFDHAGGSTRQTGSGLAPTFNNARYHIQKTHWEWAQDPGYREKASFLSENIEPLKASGQVNLVEGNGQLFEGVELIEVNGHTKAQQLVKITGENDKVLLYLADLVPTTAHIRPAWMMGYDNQPLVTLDEKVTLVEQAYENGWSLFYEHDPFVTVTNLKKTERGIQTSDKRTLEEL